MGVGPHDKLNNARPIRPEPHRSPARRQRPHGAVQLAARARARRALSSCASRTPTSSARRAESDAMHPRRSALARPDLGRRARRSAGRSVRIARPSGSANTRRARACCWRRSARTTASARPSSSRPSARKRSRITCRRNTPAAARRSIRRRRSGACSRREPAAVRFRTPENREIVFTDLVRGDIRFHTDVIGDQVLLRSDGHPAYNFAVVVDDGLMGVTHVVRGEDHISNTPRQLLIYEALGFDAARVRPRGDGARSRPHEAVEAPRRGVGGRISREGLPAGSASELSRAAELVAGREPKRWCRSRKWRSVFR